MTSEQVINQLGKLISEAGSSFGARPDDVFNEWLAYVRVILETSLRPFRDGVPFDAEAVGREETRLRERFNAKYGNFDSLMKSFREAARLWIEWSGSNVYDTLGVIYTLFMNPNENSGQYFTPWHVSVFCAQMLIGGREAGTRMVFDRIREAVTKLSEADAVNGILAESIIMSSMIVAVAEDSAGAFQSSFQTNLIRLIPLIAPYYVPISINDPAIGSGGMLLAAATLFPAFANRLGLVRYSGQDIDHTCVEMARLNMMIYGLNGWGMAAVVVESLEAGESTLPTFTADTAPAGFIQHDNTLKDAGPAQAAALVEDGRVIDLSNARQMALVFDLKETEHGASMENIQEGKEDKAMDKAELEAQS